MDKLKPLLIYKFWVLFGVAVILPPIGWWSATGDLAEQIDQRTSTLDNAFNGIPNGADAPNQSWIDEIAELNETRKKKVRDSVAGLWERQNTLMTWPESIQEQMASCSFHQAPAERELRLSIPDVYSQDYPFEIDKLWRIVEPLDEDAESLTDADAPKKVVFKRETIPQFPTAQWENLPPTWREIWNAQEDVWLAREVLMTIARVNQESTSILDAHIKAIEELKLFGGMRAIAFSDATAFGESTGSASAADVADDYDDDDDDDDYADDDDDDDDDYADDDDDDDDYDDYADDDDDDSGGYAPGFGGGATWGSLFGGQRASSGTTRGSTFTTDVPLEEEFTGTGDLSVRYVNDSESRPYQMRGFRIRVVMDHRRIPDLLSELANAEWPITIVRVHWIRRSSADMPAVGASSRMSYPAGQTNTDLSRILSGTDTESAAAANAAESFRRQHALAEAALTDKSLATVSIVGVITMYRPPESLEPQTDEGTDTPSEEGAT